MKKITFVVFLILIVSVFMLLNQKKGIQKGNNAKINEVSSTQKIISISEIAKHNFSNDCWFAISGKVYNVTNYISSGFHPGGEAIKSGCGKDATQLFNVRPGSGTPHSDKARTILTKYQIGILGD